MSVDAPLTWIELSRAALKKNLDSLSKMAGERIIAVSVKANAYGHGLPEIVSMLANRKDVQYVSVHSVQEAAACRQAGWSKKIMVLGPVATADLHIIFDHRLEPVVFTLDELHALGQMADERKQVIPTHLKLETGTNRQGITAAELGSFAEAYGTYQYLELLGASTHFANIEDTTNHEYAQYQLEHFNNLVSQLTGLGFAPKLRHTAASAALILFDKTRFELVRPGIAAYGHWPSKETYLTHRLQGGEQRPFEPVLTWRTRITQLKDLPADAFIGYGCTYRTTAPTKLAILPIGYYDGYDRLLSNQAYVLIRGKRSPVRGRVCMNLMMVDVTDIEGVSLGDQVTLIGPDGGERLPAERLADWAQSINYEVLARLGTHIPRRIIA